MHRFKVRIIGAPAVADAFIGQLEALEGFTVAHTSGPVPARKVSGAVRRYVTVAAEPGWASIEPRSAAALAAELEAATEWIEELNRLLDDTEADLETELGETSELRQELSKARAENEQLRNRLFGTGLDRSEVPA